jgi:hypothetical protein
LRFACKDIKLLAVDQSMALGADQRTGHKFPAASGTGGDDSRIKRGHGFLGYNWYGVRTLYVKRRAGC